MSSSRRGTAGGDREYRTIAENVACPPASVPTPAAWDLPFWVTKISTELDALAVFVEVREQPAEEVIVALRGVLGEREGRANMSPLPCSTEKSTARSAQRLVR
jgi:hypothetical protein